MNLVKLDTDQHQYVCTADRKDGLKQAYVFSNCGDAYAFCNQMAIKGILMDPVETIMKFPKRRRRND